MSQLNFFMTSEEIETELEILLKNNDVLIFKENNFDVENPLPISTIDEIQNSKNIIIWLKNEICEPNCLTKIYQFKKTKFMFDFYTQPIIELNKSNINGKLISPGRLFYKSGWIENTELGNLHAKMAKKIIKNFNKNLKEISKPFKISFKIEELINKGYEIELGIDGFRINEKTLTSHNSGLAQLGF
jgi:hypothetical protein